jgi:hypothetical protein
MHEYYDWDDRNTNDRNISPGSQILFLEFDDANTVLTHYMHLNLGLNGCTPANFKYNFDKWQSEMSFIKNWHFDSCKFMNGELLHRPILDLKFYEECCDWFGFEKFYDHACEIHDAWMQCRYRSARDFHAYFTGAEFNQYLEKIKYFGNSSI